MLVTVFGLEEDDEEEVEVFMSLELGTAAAARIVGLSSAGTTPTPKLVELGTAEPPPLAALELGSAEAAPPPPPVELVVFDSEAIFLLLVVVVEDYKNIDVHYYTYS